MRLDSDMIMREDNAPKAALEVDRLEVTVQARGGNGDSPLGNVVLRPDGKLWHESSSYGGKCIVPLPQDMLVRAFGGNSNTVVGKVTGVLEEGPKDEWLLPQRTLQLWGKYMLDAFSTESICIYGKRKIRNGYDTQREMRRPIWMAVFPKQEVSGGSTDVDDFGLAGETLSGLGYKRVGTIHTHPGNMVSCSMVDEKEMWEEFGGIHYIIARQGGVGLYYSAGGCTWEVDKEIESIVLQQGAGEKGKRGKRGKKKRKSNDDDGIKVPFNMIGEDGSKDIQDLVETYVSQKQAYYGYPRHLGYEDRGPLGHLGHLDALDPLDREWSAKYGGYSGYSMDEPLPYGREASAHEHSAYEQRAFAFEEATRQRSMEACRERAQQRKDARREESQEEVQQGDVLPFAKVPAGALYDSITEGAEWGLYKEAAYKMLGHPAAKASIKTTEAMIRTMEMLGRGIVRSFVRGETEEELEDVFSLYYGYICAIEVLLEEDIGDVIGEWRKSLGVNYSLEPLDGREEEQNNGA